MSKARVLANFVSNGYPWSDGELDGSELTGTLLPDQTGNSGKYLTTDGTDASWADTGASASGVIWENAKVITDSHSLSSAKNGFSVGPISISSGVSVTVPSDQRWVII